MVTFEKASRCYCVYLHLEFYIGTCVVTWHYRKKKGEEWFNPSVQTVLVELTPKLMESGYEVELIMVKFRWCHRPARSLLRFTPLTKEDVRAIATSQNDQTGLRLRATKKGDESQE